MTARAIHRIDFLCLFDTFSTADASPFAGIALEDPFSGNCRRRVGAEAGTSRISFSDRWHALAAGRQMLDAPRPSVCRDLIAQMDRPSASPRQAAVCAGLGAAALAWHRAVVDSIRKGLAVPCRHHRAKDDGDLCSRFSSFNPTTDRDGRCFLHIEAGSQEFDVPLTKASDSRHSRESRRRRNDPRIRS